MTRSTTGKIVRAGSSERGTGVAGVRVEPLDAALGAQVHGIDARSVDPGEAALLREALTEHHVLVLRDQDLDDDQQSRFAEIWGELFVDPVSQLVGAPKAVSYIQDDASRPPAEFPWHTDMSWLATPPACAVLNARVIPPTGGDTLWVDLCAAYDSLSPTMRQRVGGLRLCHRPLPRFFETVRRHHGDQVTDQLVADHPPLEHPLVRTHPVSGRPALFVCPLYGDRIAGLSDDESGEVLAELHERLEDESLQVRWRWRTHDLVVWDEASTNHRALGDHHPRRRVMRRCAVVGTHPFHRAAA